MPSTTARLSEVILKMVPALTKDEALTPKEVAAVFRCTTRTLRLMLAEGRVKLEPVAWSVPHRPRYLRSDVERALRQRVA